MHTQFPAMMARVIDPYFGEVWALWSKNTESIVIKSKYRNVVEKYAAKNGYKITKVINDYN